MYLCTNSWNHFKNFLLCPSLCPQIVGFQYSATYILYDRVEWFFRNKNLATCHVVVDCYGTPNPKCHFDVLLHLKKNVFLSLLKSKNWRDTQNKFVFPLSKSKTVLPVFEKLKKNTKHTLILKFLCDNCSLMYKKGFCKFSKTYHFKVPVIFWKWKLCQSRCKICRFFWNWTYKNITNRQPSAHFVNCKKMKITPP